MCFTWPLDAAIMVDEISKDSVLKEKDLLSKLETFC
jgi:hypothetical protein